MTKKILLTGANGFLGAALFSKLCMIGETVRALRNASNVPKSDIVVGDIDANTDWKDALTGVKTIVHCAARAHIMKESISDPLEEYRKVNTFGTLNLAKQAASAGVKRFVFISSIKVNGESTTGASPFREDDNCSPVDPYGISKLEAEQGLLKISERTGMEVVIIRPPLIYGPGVKANFQSLMRIASSTVPLPFGSIANARSMVYIGNLVDFIVKAVTHPAAANQVFIVSDGEDVSLSDLIRYVRVSIGRKARLIPVPVMCFKFIATLAGKRATIERLIGSLQVDSTKAQRLLDWQPPYSVKEGIEVTMEAFTKGKV
ncbi:SDR family oxidoreductase [Simiduia curdlanivorans]|uniref:UDP-glucose 4-epimerase family protein n=1 Tax=Simiduia curdlanivorans TaxID=1492769 RepID=A0ABV8V4A6_9GAMM|nr:SDR family oxidoreductase [Simiduia curdlanivorans]MDN3639974.1 SDR family oxidoreductase [Simiduia curdlanivorans]